MGNSKLFRQMRNSIKKLILTGGPENYLDITSLTFLLSFLYQYCLSTFPSASLYPAFVFQTSKSLGLFSICASVMHLSTVECIKLASIPNVTRMLYVELSRLGFSLGATIQFCLQQS